MDDKNDLKSIKHDCIETLSVTNTPFLNNCPSLVDKLVTILAPNVIGLTGTTYLLNSLLSCTADIWVISANPETRCIHVILLRKLQSAYKILRL